VNEQPFEPDDEQTSQCPAEAASALIRQILSLLLTGFAMLQLYPMLPLSTRLMLLALTLLSLRFWGGLMLLIAAFVDLYARDYPRNGIPELADAIPWTLLFVAVAMCGFRQRRILQQLSSRSISSILRDIRGHGGDSRSPDYPDSSEFDRLSEPQLADRLLQSGVLAVRGLLLLLVCTVSASVLLEWLPRGSRLTRQTREYVAGDPTLSEVALFATILAAALLLIGELSWRQITPAQARMYLRSLRLELFFGDLRMLSRGRLKERLRRVRERADTSK
jgi:hypothetical protein